MISISGEKLKYHMPSISLRISKKLSTELRGKINLRISLAVKLNVISIMNPALSN